jgi:serine/threonine-protein kinase
MPDLLERLCTALSDRYAVEREIGRGGMATVYLAEDLKHHRKVAIKVLQPELTAAVGPDRFLREIAIAARLNHPHILALHDSGEADGFLYYVMPYVEGESLRAKVAREKQLAIDEAVALTGQVASALDYAHGRGVIHRDIKPENILLHRGEVVVADFGIALAVTVAGGERLTATGLSLGTPAYMSPEQASGEQAIDARSDVYSLACVLYEMLAGDPPFVASSPRAVVAKHMTDPAPPITTVRSSVPLPVAAALSTALAKTAADRFGSAKEFSEALFSTTVAVKEEKKSIVVLPFENLSPDPDNAFFADGLTEELIAELARLQQLRVISRTSAMRFKGSGKDVPTIARELNVRYALEGSVRRAAGTVRITAQLIDAGTDSHLWAERYTGTLEDIFDLQENLARRIVAALEVSLTPRDEQRLAARRISDVRAYDAWLRARQEFWTFSERGFNRGKQLLVHALEITGHNALLYAGLGNLHAYAYDGGISHEPETLVQAEGYANKALEMDPQLGPALHAKALVRYNQGTLEEAVRLMRRASDLDRDTDALCFLAFVLSEVGKVEEGRQLAEEAFKADPLHMHTGFFRACVEVLDGNFDEASERFQEVLDSAVLPDTLVLWWWAQSLALAGREDEADEIAARGAALEGGVISDLCELIHVALRRDHRALNEGLQSKSTLLAIAKTDEWFPNAIATCLSCVGDVDGALEWLERAIAWGFSNDRFLSEHNRYHVPLRGDPRFETLLKRARKQQEAFEA